MKIQKLILSIAIICIVSLTSCSGVKNLVVPHSVNSASALSIDGLNLQKGEYDILNSISESASVKVEYHADKMTIKSGEGEFYVCLQI